MGQIVHMRNPAFGPVEVLDSRFRKIYLTRMDLQWLAKFASEQKLIHGRKKYARVDSGFAEFLIHYRSVWPLIDIQVAAIQADRWSREIKRKIWRSLRELSKKETSEPEICCLVNFCLDAGIAHPRIPMSDQSRELDKFLMGYAQGRRQNMDPPSACTFAIKLCAEYKANALAER